MHLFIHIVGKINICIYIFYIYRFAPTTVAKLKWAVSLFKDWQKQRNDIAVDQDISPIRVELEEMTKDELNFSISRFICEIKKRDGNEYPSDTLYSLVVCLQLHMDTIGKQHKFLNDEVFSQIKNTLDNVMKSRARNHVNVPRKQAEEITLDEEENLWNKGALGADNPKQLVNTMVYLIGARFALRGGQEHRELRFGETSQLKLGENEHGRFLKFTEDYSKANQGGLKHRKVSPKQVSAFENTICPDRCIVKLYEKYVSHRPPSDVTGVYAFYLRPLEKPKGDIWYSSQCIGRHKLSNTVADICSNAGLTGFRTNHSLRASAASRLHNAGVDEQLICEVTGHRSNAVRSYKRTSEGQKRRLSDILQGQGKKIAVGDDSRATVVEHKLSNESEAKVSLTVNITMPTN